MIPRGGIKILKDTSTFWNFIKASLGTRENIEQIFHNYKKLGMLGKTD